LSHVWRRPRSRSRSAADGTAHNVSVCGFEHAAALRPNYGKPRLLLAEAYEKKHDADSALRYYKEYLKVYPDAPDAKKIQKKIEKLSAR